MNISTYVKYKTAIGIAIISALIASPIYATQIDLVNWGNLEFYYDASGSPLVKHTWLPNTFPYSYEILPGNPYQTESLGYGVPDASQPIGVSTHAVSFNFYSQNYFSKNPNGHIALVLKGRWSLDNPETKLNELELSGRGIIIGTVSGAVNGCSSPRVAQVEGFATGGGLLTGTCSSQLQDNVWYKILVHANNNRWVAYDITDSSGSVIYGSYAIQDSGQNISETLGGWGLGVVFTSEYAPTWKIWVSDLKTWWF